MSHLISYTLEGAGCLELLKLIMDSLIHVYPRSCVVIVENSLNSAVFNGQTKDGPDSPEPIVEESTMVDLFDEAQELTLDI